MSRTVWVEVEIDPDEINLDEIDEYRNLRDGALKALRDLSAIHYQHPEDYRRCNQCAEMWPCEHAQIVRELEDAVGVRG